MKQRRSAGFQQSVAAFILMLMESLNVTGRLLAVWNPPNTPTPP